MAESRTTRFGLARWSADTDGPGRVEFDDSFANLAANAAGLLRGTLAARPAAAPANERFLYYVDSGAEIGQLHLSNGTGWVHLNPPANITYASATELADADAAAEAAGASTTVARGDHKHAVPTAAPGTSAVGDAAAAGTLTSLARSDHRHAREGFSATAPPGATAGGVSAVGTGTSPARSDHTHGLTAAAAGGSAVADVAAEGTAATVARSDHRHGREAFGSPTAATVGQGSTAGTATTLPRSDHSHGLPAGSPVSSALGDTTADGTSTSVARADHRHGREAFSATAPTDVVHGSGATGSSASPARADHSHQLAQDSVSLTIGSVIVAPSGWSIDTANSIARRYGGLLFWSAIFVYGGTTAITPGADNNLPDTTVGTVQAPYRPLQEYPFVFRVGTNTFGMGGIVRTGETNAGAIILGEMLANSSFGNGARIGIAATYAI